MDDDLEPLLAPGERIRAQERPHPVHLVRRVLRRLVQLLLLVLLVRALGSATIERILGSQLLLSLLGREEAPPLVELGTRLAVLGMLAVVALGALDALRWRLTVYAVTDQRLLQRTGVLDRSLLETPLDRIDDLFLVQSWLGRRLDYGDLVALTGSQEGGNALLHVPQPLSFRQALHGARERWLGLREGAPAAAAARRPASRPS